MLYALLTLAASAVAWWMALGAARATREARGWPTAPGRLLERDVTGAGQHYEPRVRYTYTVGGTGYTGDRLYPYGQPFGLAGAMRKLVDGLPDPVPVRYDPNDPGRSYLVEFPRGTLWLLRLFGAATLVVGLLMLLVAVAERAG